MARVVPRIIPKRPQRVRIEISFEVERGVLPSNKDLQNAFTGAVDGILKTGEPYYSGHLGAKFIRPRKS